MDTTSLKRGLIGTLVGEKLQHWRDKWDLLSTSNRYFEEAGMIANDMLFRKLMIELNVAGKTFLDIGAHLGSVTASVMRFSPQTRVVAFEAIPKKAAELRRKFPNLIVQECALSNSTGNCTFYVSASQSGYSSLARQSADYGGGVVPITVTGKRLDEIELPGVIDVMKIDVEGAEQGVIEGGKTLIGKNRPMIFFESGPQDIPSLNFTKTAMWDLLDQLDYAILLPARLAHAQDRMSREGFIESHLYPRFTNNYVAIPHERRDEIRQRTRETLGFTD